MTTNQFENSRVSGISGVSEGTLQTERPASQAEISNMIAEGGPVAPQGNISPASRLAAASILIGARVLKSAAGEARGEAGSEAGSEELGHIEEIMLDLRTGRIAYAVLSFSGFPGIANKRFPVPWSVLQVVQDEFILDLDRETLAGAPDFDKDNWPDMADPVFGRIVHQHYGTPPYWQHLEPTTGYQAGLRH